MRMQRVPVVMLMVCLLSLSGCATTANKSTAKKRQAVLDMKNEFLSDLYKIRPDVKPQISSAPGNNLGHEILAGYSFELICQHRVML